MIRTLVIFYEQSFCFGRARDLALPFGNGGAGVWVTRGKVHFSNLINFNFNTAENYGVSARAEGKDRFQPKILFTSFSK